MGIFLQATATACLVWLIYHYFIIPLFLSPLSKIPNAHFTSPCISTWIWWKRRTGFETRSIFAAHQKYGSIVRLAPNEVSVASLDGLRQVYLGGFDRSPWYNQFVNYQTPSLVNILPREQHSTRKRMLTHVFSKSYLQGSTDLQTISSVLLFRRLLPFLHSMALTDNPIDVFQLFQATSIDFMSAYLFGLTKSTNFMRNLSSFQRYLSLCHAKVRFYPNRARAAEKLEAHCLSLCRAAESFLQSSISSEDMMQETPCTNPVVYSQLSSSLSKSGLSPEHKPLALASEMLDSMDAGREVTGVALTYLFYELSRNPTLQTSLRTELLALSPRITYPSTSQSDSQAQALPLPHAIDSLALLNGIVDETLRLHAPVPGPQKRIVPSMGTIINGYSIPGGVEVSTSARCLHQNEKIFPNPSVFVPERWMQGGESAKGNGYDGNKEMRRWFWAFGSGGRMCIGNHFALQVIKLLVSAIYTNFTTTIVDDEGIEHRDEMVAGPMSDKLILQFHHIS
ncbi:cytochrome P450 [Zopfia rhizophila CBS 207.26]|uniref:Cytochrome P450 n=1 Tax=Zopfia rhizophila CBS 207.26 TaxID=1314779 RepID=A0A6A6EBY7_9PEZI|nr:cytochrome P450 [Zopfia rhizophila CBS 207.26]